MDKIKTHLISNFIILSLVNIISGTVIAITVRTVSLKTIVSEQFFSICVLLLFFTVVFLFQSVVEYKGKMWLTIMSPFIVLVTIYFVFFMFTLSNSGNGLTEGVNFLTKSISEFIFHISQKNMIENIQVDFIIYDIILTGIYLSGVSFFSFSTVVKRWQK